MSPEIRIAPVRKSLVVQATAARAFELFTVGIDRWWPRSHNLGNSAVRESVIEPRVGGRWYTKHEDGSEAVVGHVLVWQPAERFVVTWEINAEWKSDPRPAFTSELEVRFIAEPGGSTRVELEHRDFERMGAVPGATMRSSVDRGWPGLLECFTRAAANPAQ